MTGRALTALFVATLAMIPSAAFAQSSVHPNRAPIELPATQQEKAAVSFLLRAHHDLPPREAFERAATAPKRILVSIVERGNGRMAERALEALFLWKDADTLGTAIRLLSAPSTSEMRQHRLLLLLAQTFPERSMPYVGYYLSTGDQQLRMTAAAALGTIGTDESFELLETAASIENDAAVLATMKEHGRTLR